MLKRQMFGRAGLGLLFVGHQRRYGVKRLCTILGIAHSGFRYRHRTAADRAARQTADARLAARTRAVHLEPDGTYTVPGITAGLREKGERIHHGRIAHVMRSIGPTGVPLGRRHPVHEHDQLQPGQRSPTAYERTLRTTPTTPAKAA
ncbi:hypothetical protein [Streptomyces sp. NPDC056672]|uniref:hypothetical protein n=1 Tax=Streptomyces sp. NPDC056672 TaxID=3345906 RepID=UPI00369A8775